MIVVDRYKLAGDGGFFVLWHDERQDGIEAGTHVTVEWVEALRAQTLKPLRQPDPMWVQLRNALRDGFNVDDLPIVVAWWRQEYEALVYARLDAKQSGRRLAEFMRSR